MSSNCFLDGGAKSQGEVTATGLDVFNGFFSNIISKLNIPKKYQCFLNDVDSDLIISVLIVFKIHPSIKNIKSKTLSSTFSFENTYTDVVMKVMNSLNVAKTCQVNDIPTKVIKINKDIFANFITNPSINLLLMVNFLMN